MNIVLDYKDISYDLIGLAIDKGNTTISEIINSINEEITGVLGDDGIEFLKKSIEEGKVNKIEDIFTLIEK